MIFKCVKLNDVERKKYSNNRMYIGICSISIYLYVEAVRLTFFIVVGLTLIQKSSTPFSRNMEKV